MVACVYDLACRLCRLLSKAASGNISAEQHASYLSGDAARKGLVQDLIKYTAARNGPDPAAADGLNNALKGITPDYQQLAKWLPKNEWPTKVYDAQYREVIYELS